MESYEMWRADPPFPLLWLESSEMVACWTSEKNAQNSVVFSLYQILDKQTRGLNSNGYVTT